MPNEEVKAISPLIQQQILRMLGSALSTYNGADIYYYVRATYMMISDLEEDYVKEEWEKKGGNWEKTKKNLEKLDKKANYVKAYFDSLEDKKFEKKKKELEIKKYYIKGVSKIPLLMPEFFDLFVFLLKKTPLHRQTIPSQAFKIIEHKKVAPFGEKKPRIQNQSTQISQESD